MAEFILLTFIFAALAAYAVFGGADFGAGVWEFNMAFRAPEEDRRLLYRAIGPVWEANHVWLIFVLMVLWAGFPLEFAWICQEIPVPMALALAGIVFRGAAYAFRASLSGLPRQRRIWETVFAFASTAAPFFFGCGMGRLSLGRPAGKFPLAGNDGHPLTDWLQPESLFFGFFAVGICVFVSAVFLVREAAVAQNRQLEDRWRKRALWMAWVVGAFSIAGLVIVVTRLESTWQSITGRGWPAVAGGLLFGTSTIFLLTWRRYWLASVAAGSAVAAVLLGWMLTRYGIIHDHPGEASFAGTPENVRWILIYCISAGMVLILPPLAWLLYLFKSAPQQR